jgi:anthranilate synthase component 1
MQIRPSLDEVRALREQGNLCPIYAEILADLETPVSAFLKVARGPWSFLLESVEGGQHVARYSFIGAEPYMTLRFADGLAHAVQGGYKQTLPYDDPLAVLGSYLREYRPVRLPDLPRFVGGAVGYMSYETVGHFERLPLPERRAYAIPEGMWQFVDTLLAFDHLRHKIKVISHVHLDADDLETEYARAAGKLEGLIARLAAPLPRREALVNGAQVAWEHTSGLAAPSADPRPPTTEPGATGASSSRAGRPFSNVSQAEYERRVLKAKEYIAAGDIFQVVPSQRFSRPVSVDSFTIYRALRTINPSPYMFYLRSPEGELVGASPEHLMLVDLGRNDIGRVSKPGTVSVPEFMFVEKFSHVMHLVSHVTGQLRGDMSALDALRACFPAGTVSGAPKIRAMQIIAELEGEQRGIYAGAVGHVGFNGDLDTCIALRTMLVKDGVAYVQAGGGVVADSDPTAEFNESYNKAAALLRAIEEAESLAR